MLFSAKYLAWDVKYKFFVRAWYASDQYEVFSSVGITQDEAPPALGKQRGAEVGGQEYTSSSLLPWTVSKGGVYQK